MGNVVSAVLKPFAKIAGMGPPRGQLPAGYESVQTGTETSYSEVTGDYGETSSYSQEAYDKLVAQNAREQNMDTGGMYTPMTPDRFANRFTKNEKKIFEILPINRNDPPPAAASAPPAAAPARPPPAATPPPARSTPAPSPAPTATTSVPRAPTASPAPPAGGVQPAQPAQPTTSATTAAITPRPVVSGSTVSSARSTGVSRRRGRSAFRVTSSVGLAPAPTAKKSLLGA